MRIDVNPLKAIICQLFSNDNISLGFVFLFEVFEVFYRLQCKNATLAPETTAFRPLQFFFTIKILIIIRSFVSSLKNSAILLYTRVKK